MIHIFKYLDKKTKIPNHYWSTGKWGLALGQPLVVAKALSIDQNNTYTFPLFGNLLSLVFCLFLCVV